MKQRTDSEAKEKLFDLIKDIRVALMVTHDGQHQLSARPMSAAALEKFDGEVWFFTAKDSPKIEEIQADPNVLLTYANPSHQEYISLRGKASIVDDRAKIDEYWSEMVRVWFPQGKNDPNLTLIRVTVETAEFWDSPSSAMVLLYGYAKAMLTGTPPKDMGDTGRVVFPKSA